ncbi:SGNH hydrolase-type esterase domain containing protein [Rhypophila decipiens]
MFISTLLASLPVVAGLGWPLDRPYVKPTQPVSEIIALGDSFTSGVGSNGLLERFAGVAGRGLRSYPIQMVRDLDMWEIINGERKEPRLTFLAHHSDTTEDVIERQLVNDGPFQKDSWELARGAPFGNPQLAVMTVGGNDASVAYILNDCVFRAWRPQNCDETINRTVSLLMSTEYESRLRNTMLAVIAQGRKARGAYPPESFQLYVAEYANIFNDNNPECDQIDWRLHSLSEITFLTRELRKKFTLLNTLMNAAAKRAAEGLKDKGVIYVEGINRHFDGHRFCEDGQTSQEMDHVNTWLWSHYSDTVTKDDPPLPSIRERSPDARDTDFRQPWSRQVHAGIYENVLLDFVFPNQTSNGTLFDSGAPPWTWPGADRYPDFGSLMKAMQATEATVGDMELYSFAAQLSIGGLEDLMKWGGRQARDVINYLLPFHMSRSFHPKGKGYQVMKERMFAAILQNREIAHRNRTITQHLTGPVILG